MSAGMRIQDVLRARAAASAAPTTTTGTAHGHSINPAPSPSSRGASASPPTRGLHPVTSASEFNRLSEPRGADAGVHATAPGVPRTAADATAHAALMRATGPVPDTLYTGAPAAGYTDVGASGYRPPYHGVMGGAPASYGMPGLGSFAGLAGGLAGMGMVSEAQLRAFPLLSTLQSVAAGVSTLAAISELLGVNAEAFSNAARAAASMVERLGHATGEALGAWAPDAMHQDEIMIAQLASHNTQEGTVERAARRRRQLIRWLLGLAVCSVVALLSRRFLRARPAAAASLTHASDAAAAWGSGGHTADRLLAQASSLPQSSALGYTAASASKPRALFTLLALVSGAAAGAYVADAQAHTTMPRRDEEGGPEEAQQREGSSPQTSQFQWRAALS
ncbi:hypothetical protein EON68_02355 [archaeon]|nr:MAG: hypothetical protein EON68_02355 [archaeon]